MKLILSVGAFLLLLFVYFKNDLIPVKENIADTSKIPNTKADFFFEAVSIKTFNAEGRQTNKVSADKIEHFKQQQQSLISNPKIDLISPSGGRWNITADSGAISHLDQKVRLDNSVDLVQEKTSLAAQTDETNKTTMKTSALTIDLSKNIASTSQPVEIKIGNFTTHASGFKANINQEKIDFLGNVKSKGALNE